LAKDENIDLGRKLIAEMGPNLWRNRGNDFLLLYDNAIKRMQDKQLNNSV
jgi:hypothetical protein